MPIFNQNTLFQNRWGSAGEVTAYHRYGKIFLRSKSKLTFQASPAQLSSLDVHRRALAAWRTITQEVQECWQELARGVASHQEPFGVPNHISGHNLFVSAYHGFCTLGDEHLPEPKQFEPFPDFFVEFTGAEALDVSGVRIFLQLSMPECANPSRYALLCKVQIAQMGKGCDPGKMKNVLAAELEEPDRPSRSVAIGISDLASFCGFSCREFTLHLRCLLIDRVTGYRNNFKQFSVIQVAI